MSDGTGRIYKRGNVWWIQYGFRGKDHRESSGSRKKKVATALLRKRMEEMGRGRLVGPQEERVTFADLARWIEDDYRVNGRRSLDRMLLSLDHLRGYFGDDRALDITTDRLRAYIVARQGEGAANATIRQELAALRRAFNLGIQGGQLTRKPHIPTVRVENTREESLSMADVEAICANLHDPETLAPVIRFAAYTEWRKREVLGLTWARVDFEAGELRLEASRSKNAEGRTFPFGALPPLEALLREQRARTDAVERRRARVVRHVFHRDGEPIRSMRGAWKGAIKRAGLPGAWFHDLRRCAVVNLERAGVPRSVAMKLTGHKTESVYRRYAIADAAALEEGVQKLAQLHEAGPGGRKVIPIDEREAEGGTG